MIKETNDALDPYVTGQLLVAMPQLQDARFQHSVIYMCGHDKNGAMGIVINKLIENLSLNDLLGQLHLTENEELSSTPVHFGGPVEMGRGFVLHTTDYLHEGSILVSDEIALSTNIEVLNIIGEGDGPLKKICALGYAGWASNQLDEEIQANSWLQVPADQDILFHTPLNEIWEKSLLRIGVSPDMLTFDAGHA